MMLLIDIGNSRSKWALTDKERGPDWRHSGHWDNAEFAESHWRQQLQQFTSLPYKIEQVAVSCVAGAKVKQTVAGWIKEVLQRQPLMACSQARYSKQHYRLVNCYAKPEALGVDRWLALIAGSQLTERAFAVIDAGTAITLDVVDAQGQHLGGHIIPGQQLMQNSLLGDTGQIAWSAQQIAPAAPKPDWLGANTLQAIELGTLHASVAYFEYCVEKLKADFAIERFLITGGGGKAIIQLLKGAVGELTQYHNDLVLQGLYYYLMEKTSPADDRSAN